jgi:hypothetical protein
MTVAMVLGALPVALLGFVTDVGVGITMLMSLSSGILVLGGNIGLNAISSMIYPTFIRSTATGAAFAVARIGAIIGPALRASSSTSHAADDDLPRELCPCSRGRGLLPARRSSPMRRARWPRVCSGAPLRR